MGKIKQFLISRTSFCIQVIIIFAGFAELLLSDAYYAPYLLIVLVALLCLWQNYKKLGLLKMPEGLKVSHGGGSDKPLDWITVVFAVVFALMVALANYPLWTIGGIGKYILFAIIFLGSGLAFGNIFIWISNNFYKLHWKRQLRATKPVVIFFITFAVIIAINLTVFFLCEYPGILTNDSLWQVTQVMDGNYSNHHPFWHTMIIKVFMDLGFGLFGDINAAVATYSVASIIFMAIVFSFAVATIEELSPSRWIVVLSALFFVLMPYHIVYSMTMWKDVFFGGFVLLFCVFFFRCITKMSLMPFNYVGLVFSCLGFCLLRSNGLFAFALVAVCFVLFWKMQYKGILVTFIGIIVLSFILTNPVLKGLNVEPVDLIESLSIPAQQLARDMKDNDDFSDEELALLSEVIDVNRVGGGIRGIFQTLLKILFVRREIRNTLNHMQENSSPCILRAGLSTLIRI